MIKMATVPERVFSSDENQPKVKSSVDIMVTQLCIVIVCM